MGDPHVVAGQLAATRIEGPEAEVARLRESSEALVKEVHHQQARALAAENKCHKLRDERDDARKSLGAAVAERAKVETALHEARAVLATSDATKALVDLALRLGLATGHGDTAQDVADEIAGQVERERAALAAERERTEKAVDLGIAQYRRAVKRAEVAERALAEARAGLEGALSAYYAAEDPSRFWGGGGREKALVRIDQARAALAAIDRALAPAPPMEEKPAWPCPSCGSVYHVDCAGPNPPGRTTQPAAGPAEEERS